MISVVQGAVFSAARGAVEYDTLEGNDATYQSFQAASIQMQNSPMMTWKYAFLL